MQVKRMRPMALPGTTYSLQTSCGKIYVTVTTDDDGTAFEVFARFGKAGHCGAAIFDGMTKLISYALRSGMDPAEAGKGPVGNHLHFRKRHVCERGGRSHPGCAESGEE